MYNIIFYRDSKGKELTKEYITNLAKKAERSKDSRIKYKKIMEYLEMLELYGTELNEPYVKHLTGELWELRPLRDRLLFAIIIDNTIIILHHFMKSTQKTPKKEIDRALKNLEEYKGGR